MGAPPMPPPLIAQQEQSRASPEPSDASALRLPQQETPTPKTKMKTINWNKIPNNKVSCAREIYNFSRPPQRLVNLTNCSIETGRG